MNQSPSATLTAAQLAGISAGTVAHYETAAESYREGTWSHDVSQNVAALLAHAKAPPPLNILDFGCGPGRDLQALKALGHHPVGLDGASRFVEMARTNTGCEVWHQNFLQLNLPPEHFDGVFANASLFHVPAQELPQVLRKLYVALKPDGVFFASNPRGANDEGWYGDRYGVFHDWLSWQKYVIDAGFQLLEHYYRPTGMPREEQRWLASVWRRPRL